MIYKQPPENFAPKFEVVSCFIESEGEVLFLLRQDYKDEGNKWGVPAGKIDDKETAREAVVREIQEETGILLPENQVAYFNKVYVRSPQYDFVYHMFSFQIPSRPDIVLRSQEHKEFSWVLPQKALEMPLVLDEDDCIKLFYFS